MFHSRRAAGALDGPVGAGAKRPDGGPPIREILIPGLPGGGLSAYDQLGPVDLHQSADGSDGRPVYRVLSAHEYGHHRHGDVQPDMAHLFASNPYYRAWMTKPMELNAGLATRHRNSPAIAVPPSRRRHATSSLVRDRSQGAAFLPIRLRTCRAYPAVRASSSASMSSRDRDRTGAHLQ